MATNDYLSAAEIADIRARWECLAVAIGIDRSLTPDEEVAAEDDLRKLLAHLDAITGPTDRESGGRLVREVWIAWAKEQPAPKPSWLVEWDGLSEPDREVDRRIFEACEACGYAAGFVACRAADERAMVEPLARAEEKIASLTAELAEEQDAHRVASQALHDQTAELRDARDAIAGLAKVHLEVTAERDAARAAIGDVSEVEARLVNGGGDIAERDRLTVELAEANVRREEAEALIAGMSAAVATARADGAREEREKSDALIATLRELLGEREWDFEDNGRESNSCRTCGVTLRHGDPMKHAPGCALDAALRGDR